MSEEIDYYLADLKTMKWALERKRNELPERTPGHRALAYAVKAINWAMVVYKDRKAGNKEFRDINLNRPL